MTDEKRALINYRITKAKDTYHPWSEGSKASYDLPIKQSIRSVFLRRNASLLT